MIVQLTGEMVEVGENSVVVRVHDLAYEIFVPTSVIQSYRKPSNGKDKEAETFYTIQYIESSSGHGNQFMRLVGFKRKIEKEFFQLYTSVEGIGYKTALKSLIFPIQKIALAIERNDILTLKKLPHIGSRTAEKMVATLKGRMQRFTLDLKDEPLTVSPQADWHSEVHQVLRQVGYGESEAVLLVDQALQANPKIKTAEELIQQIFQLKNHLEPAGNS